ncbi:hypothetical protein EV361DRAFT_865170 [Lentinula raphanica]|uniref:Uncharacterized protein n=1 Tax=Lentinula raphanica TaxID=153919 RepID=A0AA38P262_9AGAR|nr:hypothetical protein FB446DRAFT_757303 [Lentinula raphanica]KAJ3825365.1 hypothetical protein F5880DRAFT_1553161 [Lentinula raphanica]KAJ3834920.1 hypothetical protein F5878DRAFT_335714 [Lentinula raphanica]KAJ3975704.1 hypothetical protein EV361DRAFT_865170 [Lentinula raphanica]
MASARTCLLSFLLICIPTFALALDDHQRASSPLHPTKSISHSPRSAPSEGYYNPLSNGGSMLTFVDGTFPPGQGEPLNIIISGNSDEAVLVDQETDGGLRNYWLSFDYAGECLGQHAGSQQAANLGDGNGILNETDEIRYDYNDAQLGTCTETIEGGGHFRYWIQNGAKANSGAIFMASSYELPLTDGHDIVSNGYNLGRDWIIGNITQTNIPTLNLTNSSTYSGTTSYGGYTYSTSVKYVSGLLNNTSIGINHNITVQTSSSNATDGLVAVLEVKITEKPANSGDHLVPFLGWPLPLILFIALHPFLAP